MFEFQINLLVILIIVIYMITIGIFFSKSKQTIGDQREAFAFRCMLFSFMVYGLVDLRFLFPTFYTSFPRWFVMLVTELGFASITWACYFWFIYVSTDTRQRRKYAVKWYVVTSIPLLITMAHIFTPLNKNLFEIHDTLIAFSNALAKIISSKNAMASRWGGDEFIIATKDPSLTENFREKLTKELEATEEITFMPSFSIGIFECTDSSISIDNALIEADKNLYRDKELQHLQMDAFQDKLMELKKE